jgi:hypothetical protein
LQENGFKELTLVLFETQVALMRKPNLFIFLPNLFSLYLPILFVYPLSLLSVIVGWIIQTKYETEKLVLFESQF